MYMVSCGERCISLRLIKGIITLAANRSTKVDYFLGFLVGFLRDESAAHVSTLNACVLPLGILILQQSEWCQSQPASLSLVDSCAVCLFPSAAVIGAASRPSLIKEHKGDCCGSNCVWVCLLAGQRGPLHMEPGPLVSFVVSLMVSTASCHKLKSGTADFPPFLGIFLSISQPHSFLSAQYSVSSPRPPYPFLVTFCCFSSSAFHRPVIFVHCVLGSAVPSCLFVFIIYSHSIQGR